MRVERLRKTLEGEGIRQCLITDPWAIYYLSGVRVYAGERFFGLFIAPDGRDVLFVNRLFPITEPKDFITHWYNDGEGPETLLNAYLKAGETFGFDREMRASLMLDLMEAGAVKTFKNINKYIDDQRAIKDEEETRLMFEASAINDKTMSEITKYVTEGVTEKELAAKLNELYAKNGGEGLAFPSIVAFGANAADPHHFPDGTRLKEGDAVLFDIGCRKRGYCSDMTRTFFYKSASEKAREVYEIVKRANESAIAAIKPGMKLCDIDGVARNIITEAGYGPQFTHRLGHFIGVCCHEPGDVSGVNSDTVKPGMTFSIEPGIYLTGDVGVRIEDLVIVTEDGCERLNKLSKDLEVLGAE